MPGIEARSMTVSESEYKRLLDVTHRSYANPLFAQAPEEFDEETVSAARRLLEEAVIDSDGTYTIRDGLVVAYLEWLHQNPHIK